MPMTKTGEGRDFKPDQKRKPLKRSPNTFLNGTAVDGGGLQVGVLVGDHQVKDVDEVGHEEAAVLKIKNGGWTELFNDSTSKI